MFYWFSDCRIVWIRLSFYLLYMATRAEKTPVSELFFSQNNIDALQHGLQYGVFKKSGIRISEQSPEELQTIMKSVYVEYGRNQPNNVLEQVRELNGVVLDFAVPRILQEIDMRKKYLSEVDRNPIPMLDRGQITSVKGTKTYSLAPPGF